MKQSKTDRTRAHIVAATAEIFNKKGYAGTSITDLTKATKLTSGSIYGNFANKEDVALAALDHNITCFHQVLYRAADKGKTAKEKLLMYISVFHSSSNANFPKGGCPMLNTLTDGDDMLAPLRNKATAGIMLWKQNLITIIENGKATGEFIPGTDAHKTALHLIALCEFALLIFSATKSTKQTDEILEMALDVVKSITTTV